VARHDAPAPWVATACDAHPVAAYDEVAACYDATRGGEERGDEYAAELDRRLPTGASPILEVGVGTGVVALGLRRRGRTVIGLDLSPAMLARATWRLGSGLVLGDARRLPFADRSIADAVSVWVAHAVDPPEAMFAEVARVLRPGSRYLVCPTNRPGVGEVIGPALSAMFDRAERVHPTWRRADVSAADIVAWGARAGLAGHIEPMQPRSWVTSAADQIRSIRDRVWPALRGLDAADFEAVTRPAVEALAALPAGPIPQHAEADIVVLSRP
jgi:ubiquinone/menaquinone biosynthesis C-methylase UbiE